MYFRPISHVQQIEQLQQAVIADWEDLQQQADHRKAMLLAAGDLHKFMTSARDLLGEETSWSLLVVVVIGAQLKM